MFLKIISAGNAQFVSSLLWIHTVVFADIEKYKKKDGNSWIYYRLNSITNLDPNFYFAYKYGGQYLSVIKDDVDGSNRILEKGLQKFSKDFWLNFHAGFNYLFELKDYPKAYTYYSRIIDTPEAKQYAPYLPRIMAKINVTNDEPELALEILKTNYETTNNPVLKESIYDAMYSIKASKDLDCLNSSKENCDSRDLAGIPYKQLDDGKFQAARPLENMELRK